MTDHTDTAADDAETAATDTTATDADSTEADASDADASDTDSTEADESQATSPADAPSPSDPDALFDRLVEEGVLQVDEEGGVRTTQSFDDGHGVYYDSYVGIDDGEFHDAVAATFGLPDAEIAAEAVESRGITREDLARYLALRAELPDDVPPDDLAVMAEMVGEAVPESPVPNEIEDVTDDPESFLASRDQAVVTVWKRFCAPCDSLKERLPEVLDAAPESVPIAGIDGEVAGEFCATYEVEAAPGVVLVRDDDFRTITGDAPDEMAAALDEFFAE